MTDAHDGQEQADGGPPAPADQLRDVHGRPGEVPESRAEVRTQAGVCPALQ